MAFKKVPLEVRGNLKVFWKDTKSTEIVLDGPAGTGKTRVALEQRHLIQCKYPGARGLITRKYRSSMNETCLQVLNNEVFRRDGQLLDDAPQWRERDQKYVYDNGAEIIVAGMDDPTKVMSSQYDWVYWNELIEGKEAEWMAVLTRLRNGRVPYQQGIGDTNPGPPHHWIKQREEDGRLRLLPTNHKDNPVYWDAKRRKWTQRGEAYINGILRDSLTGITKDRLYSGLWKSAEGLVYPEWNRDIHLIPWRQLPSGWLRYWVFDFGYIDPFVWIELAEDPETGQLYLTRELYHTHMKVSDAAKLIMEASPNMLPYALICDHDSENRAVLESAMGFLTLPAYKSIHPGLQGLANRLRLDNPRFKGQPGLFIMDKASIMRQPDTFLMHHHKPVRSEQEFDSYQWDTGKIILDKYKDLPVDKNNHGMDVLRYGVAYVDGIANDPQEFSRVLPYDTLMGEDEFEPYGSISLY